MNFRGSLGVLRQVTVLVLAGALVAQLFSADDSHNARVDKAQLARVLSPHSSGNADLDAVPGLIEAETRRALVAIHDLDPNDPRINGPWADEQIRGLMFARLVNTIVTPDSDLSDLDKNYYRWFQHLVRDVNVQGAQSAIDEFEVWKYQGCGYVPPGDPVYDGGLNCQGSGNVAGPIQTGRARQPTLDELRQWGVARAALKAGFPDLADDDPSKLAISAISGAGVTTAAAATFYFAGGSADAGGATRAGVRAVDPSSVMRVLRLVFKNISHVLVTAGFAVAVAGAVLAVLLAIVAAAVGVVALVQEAELPKQLQQNLEKSRALPDLRADFTKKDGGETVLNDKGSQLVLALFLLQLPRKPGNIDLFDPNDPTSIRDNPDRVKPVSTGSGFDVGSYDAAGRAVGEQKFVESQAVKLVGEGTTRILYDRGWIVQEYGRGYKPTLSLDYLDWNSKPRRAFVRGAKWVDVALPSKLEELGSQDICVRPEDCPPVDFLRMLDDKGNRIVVKSNVNHAPAPVTIGAPTLDHEDGPDCSSGRGRPTVCRPPADKTTLVEGGALKLWAEGVDGNRDADGDPITYRWTIEDACPVTPAFLKAVQNSVDPSSVTNDCFSIAPPRFNGPITSKEGGAVDVTWTDSGTKLVRLEASDGRGLSSVAYRSFTISNVAPTIKIASSDLANDNVKVTGCIDDPGKQYEFPGLTVDWGDGTVVNGPASGVRLKQGDPPVESTTIPSAQGFGYKQVKIVNLEQLNERVEKVDVGMTVSFDKIPNCSGTYSFTLSHTYAPNAVPPPDSSTFPVTITTNDGDGGGDSEVLDAGGASLVDATIENLKVLNDTKTAVFRVNFSQPVKGFEPSDLVLTGTAAVGQATVIDLRVDERGVSQAAVAVPMMSNGAVTLSIPAGAAKAGRRPTAASRPASTNSDTILVNFAKPTARISGPSDDLTRERNVSFDLEFSDAVNGLSLDDLELSGTAARGNPVLVGSSPGQRYTLIVPVTSDGTVVVGLRGGVVSGVAGNTVEAVTSSAVNVDQTPPELTVNQASDQADPTNAATGFVSFDVRSSEEVRGLDAADFSISGAAGTGTPTLERSGDLRSYRLRVPVAKDGTVAVALAAGAAFDHVGNASVASTSVDRVVRVDRTGPGVLVAKAPDQADPTRSPMVRFRVLTSEPVSGFGASDVRLSGTASHGAPVVRGSKSEYTVAVPATSGGTLTLTVAPGAMKDAAGNPSARSIAEDATVLLRLPPKLTVTAHDKSRPYGAADPKFTVTFQGFVDGGGPRDLTGTRTCSTSATRTSGVGDYPVTCSGLRASNYTIVYVAGTLRVTRAPTALALTPPLSSTPNVRARLTMNGGEPVPREVVSFRSGSVLLCSALTDAAGEATCAPPLTGFLLSMAGGVTAQFDGSGDLLPSTSRSGPIG